MKISLSNNKTVDIKAKSIVSKSTSAGNVASLEKQKKALVKQKNNYMKSAGKNGEDPKTVKAKVAAFDNKIKNIEKQIAAAKSKSKTNSSKANSKTSDQVIKNAGSKSGRKATSSGKSMSKMDMLSESVKQLKALADQNQIKKDNVKDRSLKKVEMQINSYKKNVSFGKSKINNIKSFSIQL